MEALFVSTGLVALAEIGDKTQLLSLVLAARYRRPWPIIAGILAATLLNHVAAAAFGAWITALIGPNVMVRAVGVSFLLMAAWILVPDKLDTGGVRMAKAGVFWATAVLFFIAEIGDKTQIATVMLAARYDALVQVVAGTTAGMMLANVPIVFFGEAVATRVPVVWVRRIAAAIFAALGLTAMIAG